MVFRFPPLIVRYLQLWVTLKSQCFTSHFINIWELDWGLHLLCLINLYEFETNILFPCCQWNMTWKKFCLFFRAGSYGNATSPEGCRGCNCNEHGNAALGVCDSTTGVCLCQDNTEGPTCDKCKKGYYGDPRSVQL